MGTRLVLKSRQICCWNMEGGPAEEFFLLKFGRYTGLCTYVDISWSWLLLCLPVSLNRCHWMG